MRIRQTKIVVFIGLGLLAATALVISAATLTNSSIPLEGTDITRQETTLGNLVADAVRSAAEADIALVNASQMREKDLAAGPITDRQIASVLAYPDEDIALLELKGATVLACLERGLSLLPKPNKGFLQVSGLRIQFDPRKSSGARVVEAKVGGAKLDPAKEYKVAMPLSLAKGAGGYFIILEGAEIEAKDTTLLAEVTAYLSKQGTASAKTDPPRLKNLSQSENE